MLAQTHGLVPGLAVVLVGENPASQVYVRNKAKMTRRGRHAFGRASPAGDDLAKPELLTLVAQLNTDPAIHGILVQLPLPKQIDAQKVIDAIDPAKDVDGFHPLNAGRLATGLPALVPCTPLGCVILAKSVHAVADRHGRGGRSAAPTSSASRWRNCCSLRTRR